jgi:NADH dehydrogenase (ubiquinone) 1 alpha subcomplex subunit 8
MPGHIPKVEEVGASSAPLMSASYFIGARCRSYNDDYMQCKTEAYGRGELECMKEGRRVTRCAASVYEVPSFGPRTRLTVRQTERHQWKLLRSIQTALALSRQQQSPIVAVPATWKGVEQMRLREDRETAPPGRKLISNNLQGLEKVIPDTPKGDVPVHLRDKQLFADRVKVLYPGEKDVGILKDTAKS